MTAAAPLRYFVVDAFTDRPFAGNPAVVIAAQLPVLSMRAIASATTWG